MAGVALEQKTIQTGITRRRVPFWRAEMIGHKLSLGFLVILILLAASGVVAYIELAIVGKDTQKMENTSMQAMDASHLQRLSETVLQEQAFNLRHG